MRNTSISIITINKIIYLIVLICTVSSNVYANPFIRLDSLSLITSKKRILEGTASKETLIAYRQLLKNADKALSSKNPSVIDKTILPPTGDKHDYLTCIMQ